MLREFLSELKLSLKMNGTAMALFLALTKKRKLKNEKLFVNGKGIQEGDFRHMYAADTSLHSCLLCCLLATLLLLEVLCLSSFATDSYIYKEILQ